MEKRELICIGCPLGCMVTVEMENGEVKSVTGNTCKRGDDYPQGSDESYQNRYLHGHGKGRKP